MATHNESDSSSSSEDDFFHERAVQPYRFEPCFSKEELETRRREREGRQGASGSGLQQTETSEGSPRDRTKDKNWCTCARCSLMPTEEECLSCHELPQAQVIVDKFDPLPTELHVEESATQESGHPGRQKSCVTQHPDFEAHLNEGVLDTYFRSYQYNWKKFPKPRGPGGTLTNAQYRLVAYRFILDWLLQGERLGKKKRIPLPACIVSIIRRKFPADDNEYTGFKYAELPTV